MNRPLHLFKSLVLFLLLAPVSLLAQSHKYSGGDGTEGSPYQIGTLADLRLLSETSDDWSKHFIQTANIDATETKDWNPGDADGDTSTPDVPMGFHPIGDDRYSQRGEPAFRGSYNGAGYIIDHLYINCPSQDYVGLFGSISGSGIQNKIRNLGVTNAQIVGANCTGTLVGVAQNITIENCYSSGSVKGLLNVGGLTGNTEFTTKCYSTAVIDCTNSVKGSLGIDISGAPETNHPSCYYLSESGDKDPYSRSYGAPRTAKALGVMSQYEGWNIVEDFDLVKGAPPVLKNIHGSAQWVMNPLEAVELTITVTNNGNAIDLAKVICNGEQFTDKQGEVKIKASTNTTIEYQIMASGYNTISGSVEVLEASVSTEVRLDNAYTTGTGTESDPYQVATFEQLCNLSQNTIDWDKHFIQTADIEASASSELNKSNGVAKGFSPIGDDPTNGTRQQVAFTGSYNGGGFKIDQLYIQRPSENNVGLFGYASQLGQKIYNLAITNANITGEDYVGIVAGSAKNTNIENLYTTGTVHGSYKVGGLAGFCGRIIHTYSTTNVVSSTNTWGSLGCFYSQSGSVHTNCFYLSTNGSANPNKNHFGLPLRSSQMQDQSNFTSWDFVEESTNGDDNYWAISPLENGGFPYLTHGRTVVRLGLNAYTSTYSESNELNPANITGAPAGKDIQIAFRPHTDDNSAAWNTNKPTKAGVYDVQLGVLTSETTLADQVEITNGWTIQKKDVAIVWDALPNKTYLDAAFDLQATVEGNGSIVYSSSNEDVATILGNTVTIVGAGTTQITASCAATENYNAPANVVRSFTVDPATATITFDALPTKTYGDGDFSLDATSDGDTEVTYSSSDETVATIVDGVVTILSAGEATITASAFASTNYLKPVSKTSVLTVEKAQALITFDALPSKRYKDAAFDLKATTNGTGTIIFASSNEKVATISENTVTIVGAGTTNITATLAETKNYKVATAVVNPLVVNKAPATITFDADMTATYGDADVVLHATVDGDGEIVYQSGEENIARIEENLVSFLNAGQTTITASCAATDNYLAAINQVMILTVNKADASIHFDPLASKSYGDAVFDLQATRVGESAIVYHSSNPAVASVSGTTVTIHTPGETVITASCAASSNYDAATDVPQTLVVNKASEQIVFDAIPAKKYGDNPFNLSASVHGDGEITYTSDNTDVATIVNNVVTIHGVGNATITASCAATALYEAADAVSHVLTVSRADASIVFNALPTKTFGDASFHLSASSYAGAAIQYASDNENVAQVQNNTVTIVGAGRANITASLPQSENYLAAADVVRTLVVNKATPTIALDEISAKTFGDKPFDLSATASNGLKVSYEVQNTNIATVAGNTVTIKNAGTTTVVARTENNPNFVSVEATCNLVVNRAAAVIQFKEIANKTYGDKIFRLEATASENAAVSFESNNESVASVTRDVVTIKGAGIAVITARCDASSNYVASSVSKTLTVEKSNASISFDAIAAVTYGDPAFSLGATLSHNQGALVYSSSNPSVATVIDGEVDIVGAGTTTITVSNESSDNYLAAASVSQELVVNKANAVIQFAPLSRKNFGEAPFTLRATSTGGALSYSSLDHSVATVNEDQCTLVGAGSTTITATSAENANYNTASVQRTLEVSKADPQFSFEAIPVKTFGDAAFELQTSTLADVVQFVSSNPDVATVSGNEVTIHKVGETTITATSQENENYAEVAVSHLLKVEQFSSEISFDALDAKTFGDDAFELTAMSNDSRAITYVSNNPYVATIQNNIVTIIGAGSTFITASCEATQNASSASVTRMLEVKKANTVITFDALADKTFGDASFALHGSVNGDGEVLYTSSNPAIASIDHNEVTIHGAGSVTITASCDETNNYLAATAVSHELVIGKALATTTFEEIANKTYGDDDFSVVANNNGDGTILMASSDPSVATIHNGIITIQGAGTATITASCGATANYLEATIVSRDLVVAKASREITFEALEAKEFGDSQFYLQASTSENGAIAYISSNSSVATVVDNVVTIHGAGTTTITASCAATANYTKAVSVDQELVVNKAKSDIIFASLDAKVYGDGSFALDAKVTGDGAIVYSSSNPDVASIENGEVTILKAGTTTITASCVATANCEAATPVSHELNVEKATRNITFENIESKQFGDAAFPLQATVSDASELQYTSSNQNVATLDHGLVSIVGVGSATITAACEETENYKAISAIQVLEIAEGDGNITWTLEGLSLEMKIEDLSFELEKATSSVEGATITYTSSNDEVLTVEDNLVTFHKLGEADIVATVTARNYTEVESTVHVKVVSKTGVHDSPVYVETIKVYPNPASEFIMVDGAQMNEISIFSILGAKVNFEQQENRIDVSNFARGVYILKYRNQVKRFIVQ
ncbi:T9SS type A sorting domain-containing protein [Halosquirtibacter laminarini]|uniref:T9SS type A sorting domain-containing protein n=1 Tax=Halosquirtibacter laminarini TaxID=3374600 RepID=A0AC61NHG0_9BACT|nr:T9SS type A sorting domain-containing protein [Prolixibacteraceae bacterium]